MSTGMRPGELRKLRWRYIDRKADFIRLPAEITKEKNEKNIPINHHVKAVLDSIPRHLAHDYVFTFRKGKPLVGPKGSYAALEGTCKKAGIPYGRKSEGGMTMHDFRRTVKTNMLNAGVDKVYRDIILGHSLQGMDIHYIAPSDDDLKKAMAKYTKWLDDQIESVDQTVDQAANC